MFLKNKLNLVKIIGAILFGFCFDTSANDNMETYFSMSPTELAEISVSIATGTLKPLAQSAAITSVITASQIKAMGATNINEILETIPGLHISIQAITNDAIYTMRGIANSINAQVLVMLNGTRYTVPYKGSHMTGLLLPVEAIGRIEVIRGPASALYGADAFSGVINIITKKAEAIDRTQIGVRAGNYDTQSAWGLYGNHHLGWDIAASLQYQHNNDDNDRIIAGDLQTQQDSVFGTQASLAPGHVRDGRETWNAHLNLDRKHWHLGFWSYANTNAGLRAGSSGSLDNEGSIDNLQYLADLRYSTEDQFVNWQLQTHMSYLYTDLDSNLHLSPDNSLIPLDKTGNINPTNIERLAFFPDGMINRLGINNQVVDIETTALFSGFTDHLWRLQAHFRYEQVTTSEQRNFGIGVLDGSETIINGQLSSITKDEQIFLSDSERYIGSLALQDEWKINQDWHLTVGIRYDQYSDFGSTFNPRAALIWNINPQLTSKILYGRAFRAPSFTEQKQKNSPLFNGNPNLEPEKIQSVEWALDYQPNDSLHTAINLYFFDISDPIEGTLINQNTNIINGQGQEGFGSELEWSWTFHPAWLLQGNYAWQYSRNKETQRRIPNVPEHQFYVATKWAFLPQWQIQTQLKWIGNRTSVENDQRELKDYETVDITLTNRQKLWGHLDITASVRNVFDSNGRETAIITYSENFPIASRSYYLEASISY